MSHSHHDTTNTDSNGKRNKVIFRLMVALTIFFLIVLIYWFIFLRNKVSTDDAYVNGYVVNLTSEVSAITVAFYCDNTDFVKKGDLLVQLDKTNFELAFEREKNALALAVRQVVQYQQDVLQAKAATFRERQLFEKARMDFENRQGLVDVLAITKEDYEHSKLEMNAAKANLSLFQHKLESALVALGETTLENHPIVEKAKISLREAYINLKRTDIYAPVDGFIAKRVVEVGKWVNPKDVMLAIISLDDVFVDANFKETQIEKIRVGQDVHLVSDLYGNAVVFNGSVVGLVPGTGSVFSLLPPQNATGNWIKIVQRVPVRISLKKDEIKNYPLLLGLSVEATVNLADQTGDFLRGVSERKVIVSTDIYHISLDEVNALIDEIILENS